MLCETTVAHLSAFTYRADAKRRFSWLPLGGIYWEDEVPDWAFFQRAKVSPADQVAQDQAERTSEEEFKAFFAEADRLTVMEKYPGVQAFSATFDLTKPINTNRKSWWKRIFSKGA
jgi:hypothetical protein